jgi:hypothetical protein
MWRSEVHYWRLGLKCCLHLRAKQKVQRIYFSEIISNDLLDLTVSHPRKRQFCSKWFGAPWSMVERGQMKTQRDLSYFRLERLWTVDGYSYDPTASPHTRFVAKTAKDETRLSSEECDSLSNWDYISHSCGCEQSCLMGYSAVESPKSQPKLQRNMQPTSSG